MASRPGRRRRAAVELLQLLIVVVLLGAQQQRPFRRVRRVDGRSAQPGGRLHVVERRGRVVHLHEVHRRVDVRYLLIPVVHLAHVVVTAVVVTARHDCVDVVFATGRWTCCKSEKRSNKCSRVIVRLERGQVC